MHRLLALLLVASCAPATYAFTPASARPVSPRPENCGVDVVTSAPSRNFEEVGLLDYYSGTKPKTLDEFKQAVTKQACQAGGDAVIATGDEKSAYAKGTIIHYLPDIAAPVAPVAKPPPPETPPKKK